MFRRLPIVLLTAASLLSSCSSTEIVDSPRTAVVSEAVDPKPPEIVWTSRSLNRGFDYLGLVKSRSLSYDGALQQIVDGATQLRADAVIDIHYEQVGFLAVMEAFAIKYR